MLSQDLSYNTLLTASYSTDNCLSSSMELPPSVLSMFPNTEHVASGDHPEDHFTNPFPNSAVPDDSLFFLFPTGGPPAPDPEVTAIPTDEFIPQAPKKEPVYDAFLTPSNAASVEDTAVQSPRYEGLKRKRPDNLQPVSMQEQKNKTILRDVLHLNESHAFYTSPSKRLRTSTGLDGTVSNFSTTIQDPAPASSVPYPTFPQHIEELPVEQKSSAPGRSSTSKSASKPRSPSKRRKKSPKSPGTSDSNSDEGNTSPPSSRKPRTLTHMKSLARSHAPEVSLTQEELHQIAGMHESEDELAMSRDLYKEVAKFKASLSRFGYRLSALTLDPVTEAGANTLDEPFDFVLKRKLRPVAPAPVKFLKPDTVKLPFPADHGVASHNTVVNCSTFDEQTGCATEDNVQACTEKRVRLSQADHSSDSSPLSCAVCTKTVSDFDTLIRHFRHGHQELKPFCCPRCKGSYSSEGTLWHHIRNVHSETPRKFRCSQCDASYDSFGAKTRHEHATHNTDTPEFICTFEECNRAFNFPAHLESHAMHDHPGFKPFGCTECTKRFNSANGLIRHKREVHRRNRAYSCSCGTTFAKKDHLKRHLLQRHSMSYEKATEEMRKQPSPGLVHFMPPAAPAAAEAV